MPYCFVKGGVESYDCYVSSLSKDEARALIAEFKCSQKEIDDRHCNKAMIKLPGASEPIPFKLVKSIKIIEPGNFVVNVLERKFGYRVVSAVGDDPTVWTMHRPSSAGAVLSPQLSSGNLLKDFVAPLKHADSRERLIVKHTDSQDRLIVAAPATSVSTPLPSPLAPGYPMPPTTV